MKPVDESSSENIETELADVFGRSDPRQINFNVNDEFKKIGEGSYGIMYKTFDEVTGNTLALKKIKNAL